MREAIDKSCIDIEIFFEFFNSAGFGFHFEKMGDVSIVSVGPLIKIA
jgi:hypothetical protein